MLGVSVLRNQHLANVFYRLKLIEAYGTGMLKINECYADRMEKPRIEVTANAFKITLPNQNAAAENSVPEDPRIPSAMPKQQIVLRLFDTHESISRKDVEAALNTSQASAVLLIRKMLEDGLLIRVGSGKNARYRKLRM